MRSPAISRSTLMRTINARPLGKTHGSALLCDIKSAKSSSGFDYEVGEGDAATGIGTPVLFAFCGEVELAFLGALAGEFDFAFAAVANPAGVIDLDAVGLRQFEK